MRRLLVLLGLVLLLPACEKKNPNYEPPPPYDAKVVDNHRFDGGATDPYQHQGGSESGESSSDAAPAKKGE